MVHVEVPGSAMAESIAIDRERENAMFEKGTHEEARISSDSSDSLSVKLTFDSTHRKLRPRHIQLIGIGGTIGTALYVQIGHGLINGGPASLFLAFTLWYVGNLGSVTRNGSNLHQSSGNHQFLPPPNEILLYPFLHHALLGVPSSWLLQTVSDISQCAFSRATPLV